MNGIKMAAEQDQFILARGHFTFTFCVHWRVKVKDDVYSQLKKPPNNFHEIPLFEVEESKSEINTDHK